MNEEFTIVIPCYNEEYHLKDNVNRLQEFLSQNKLHSEIILVEDLSTDNTPEVARRISNENNEIEYLGLEKEHGKGGSIDIAITESKHDKVVFMDADLSTDLSCLPQVLENLESNDIVIGSRLLPDSETKRSSFKREIASRAYNKLVQVATESDIRDHQCGFKAMQRDKYIDLRDEVSSTGFFWDTELLIKAQQRGLKIKEIPVVWKAEEDSSVNILQLSVKFFYKTIRLSLKK